MRRRKLVLASDRGYGFVTRFEALLANKKAGKQLISVDDGRARAGAGARRRFRARSHRRRHHRRPSADVLGRRTAGARQGGKGNKLIEIPKAKLAGGERVAGIAVVAEGKGEVTLYAGAAQADPEMGRPGRIRRQPRRAAAACCRAACSASSGSRPPPEPPVASQRRRCRKSARSGVPLPQGVLRRQTGAERCAFRRSCAPRPPARCARWRSPSRWRWRSIAGARPATPRRRTAIDGRNVSELQRRRRRQPARRRRQRDRRRHDRSDPAPVQHDLAFHRRNPDRRFDLTLQGPAAISSRSRAAAAPARGSSTITAAAR